MEDERSTSAPASRKLEPVPTPPARDDTSSRIVTPPHAITSIALGEGQPREVMAGEVLNAGHSERGRKRMIVSAIAYDAGSVAVSARPILPNTVATSLT